MFYRRQVFLVHLSDESVDLDFSVSEVTAFDEVVVHSSVATLGGRELEGPEEVVGLKRRLKHRLVVKKRVGGGSGTYSLEVGSNSVDLVDEILDGLDSDVTEGAFDNGVLREWDSLAVDLAVTSLVDHFSDGLEVGVAPGDVRQKNRSRLVKNQKFLKTTGRDSKQLQFLASVTGVLSFSYVSPKIDRDLSSSTVNSMSIPNCSAEIYRDLHA